ncbi:TonB-dependent receptor [Negadavirga shengliensis]|uniref:TonB-dependent receptor n=1 Tax=Negadavirga shengliensis TaxID=1389218 RepID=A0ABV9T3N0_9BACT
MQLFAAGDSLRPMLGDTLELQAVEVAGPKKYAYGQMVKTISEGQMQSFQGMSLADVLQQRTGLFLRQYGPGMLASLTMRGTSAGHNAVFWNGLPINSPSLGQTDFSILPVGGFDGVDIHYGSAGALYGTDAIGGSVHLNSAIGFDEGDRANVFSHFGSFGKWNQLLEYRRSGSEFSSRTKVYRNIAKNDFLYKDWSSINTPVRRQEHAGISQYGLVQDFAFKLDAKHQLSTSVWWNHTDRQIQPVIGSPTKDEQVDENIRWVADLHRFDHNKVWNFKGGWIKDRLVFNHAENLIHQYFLSGDLDWQWGPAWESRTGVRLTHIQGTLSAYSRQEKRIELYQATNFKPGEQIGFSFHLRQLMYDGEWVPLTPSTGMEWVFWETPKDRFQFSANLARSFKVPTLNDRFWVPGGNPDLEPEKSWSGELGLDHTYQYGPVKGKSRVSYFRMSVDNWIIWLPGEGYWSPVNLRHVDNQGLEFFMEVKLTLGDWKTGLEGNYAWTRAINKTADSEDDSSMGKQLPYTPMHKGQLGFWLEKTDFSIFLNTHRVGKRFIATDNQGKLEAYQLWDQGVAYKLAFWKKIEGKLAFQVNNIFNKDYQVLRLRPMPGRNYQINLNITI